MPPYGDEPLSWDATQILVESFSADPQIASNGGFLFAGGDTAVQLGPLFFGEGPFSPTISAALPGDRNAFALPLADQGTLKLRERTMTGSIRLAIGESSPEKARLSFTNSIRIPRLVRG